MKNYVIVLILIAICGCTSFNGQASITHTFNKVIFDANRPLEMSMKKDGITYEYNSQAQTWISKFMSFISAGVVGARR